MMNLQHDSITIATEQESPKNVQQYALKTKLKALQILTNDDEVEN